MKLNVKIYGAGSIGNHYAKACRNKKWNVTIFDRDPKALIRTKDFIYPHRYKKWDKKIRLISKDKNLFYDLIIIGTPPDSHLNIANIILDKNLCKVLHIEKPLCTPNLKGISNFLRKVKKSKVKVICGYNHIFTKNTFLTKKLVSNDKKIGKILTITAHNKEHWGGIFAAHPWLKGPHETYLGHYKKGGGSLCEHSHAINLFVHFSHFLNLGRVKEVSADIQFEKNKLSHFDKLNFISLKTDNEIIGSVVQDVITKPAEKFIKIQGTRGYVKSHINYDNKSDAVILVKDNKKKIFKIKKSRSDDFKGQLNFIRDLIKNKKTFSHKMQLKESVETMLIISAAIKSSITKKKIEISYKNLL